MQEERAHENGFTAFSEADDFWMLSECGCDLSAFEKPKSVRRRSHTKRAISFVTVVEVDSDC